MCNLGYKLLYLKESHCTYVYANIHSYCECCHHDVGVMVAYGQCLVILPLVFPPVKDYLFPFLSTSRAVDDHYQLIPYFLTIGADALKKGTSAMIPLAKHESFIDKVHTIRICPCT